MSPTRGYRKTMAARRRLALTEARHAEQGYEDSPERLRVARKNQDLAKAVDRMVDGDIERGLLGD